MLLAGGVPNGGKGGALNGSSNVLSRSTSVCNALRSSHHPHDIPTTTISHSTSRIVNRNMGEWVVRNHVGLDLFGGRGFKASP